VRLADLPLLFGGALGIALVAVADTTVLSQSLATRRREVVDPNQELVALGAANLAAGLFHGFPISSSASRTRSPSPRVARSQLTPAGGARRRSSFSLWSLRVRCGTSPNRSWPPW
jgi:MFS superfamily sulfate permease-like transporter